jgi:hypothetical protein
MELDDTNFQCRFGSLLRNFVKTKALTPNLCSAVSHYLFKHHDISRGVASYATLVQTHTNQHIKMLSHSEDDFYGKLLLSSDCTLVLHPVADHVDTCRKLPDGHPLKGVTTSFFENKVLLLSHKQSSFDPQSAPLGRGGAGAGKFVFGIVDHGSNSQGVEQSNEPSITVEQSRT